MNKAYLLLGSNLSDPSTQLVNAKKHLKKTGEIMNESSLYQTAAWGNTEQPDFLNQVVLLKTKLNARSLLKKILEIENKMGRRRTVKNAPRIIDIDILFYNDDIIGEKELIIPHPAIAQRRFVLVPLAELEPGYIHPVSGKSISRLLSECKDTLDVKIF